MDPCRSRSADPFSGQASWILLHPLPSLRPVTRALGSLSRPRLTRRPRKRPTARKRPRTLRCSFSSSLWRCVKIGLHRICLRLCACEYVHLRRRRDMSHHHMYMSHHHQGAKPADRRHLRLLCLLRLICICIHIRESSRHCCMCMLYVYEHLYVYTHRRSPPPPPPPPVCTYMKYRQIER